MNIKADKIKNILLIDNNTKKLTYMDYIVKQNLSEYNIFSYSNIDDLKKDLENSDKVNTSILITDYFLNCGETACDILTWMDYEQYNIPTIVISSVVDPEIIWNIKKMGTNNIKHMFNKPAQQYKNSFITNIKNMIINTDAERIKVSSSHKKVL